MRQLQESSRLSALSGKVAVITGAARGIGREAAILFAEEGAAVVVADLSAEVGEQTAADIRERGGRAIFVQANVTDRDEVRTMVGVALEHFGGLHIAFNNAGYSGVLHPFAGYPDKAFEDIMAVNVRGTWLCMQEEIPAMHASGGGSIVNASSTLGEVGCADMPAYIASKHAILGLTRAVAIEQATSGIRVNAVLPGIVDTLMAREMAPDVPDIVEAFAAAAPLARPAQPREIAEAALWLASDRSSFVTGHGMAVDGGTLSR